MSRCRSLGVMIDTRLGIYVQIDKHTEGPPVDTVVEILPSQTNNQVTVQCSSRTSMQHSRFQEDP
ncbi:hypothetical protein ACTXT7_005198 [Hymenolepis weldensis]